MVKILGKAKLDRFEVLFISELNPATNTNDKCRNRTLTLKFN